MSGAVTNTEPRRLQFSALGAATAVREAQDKPIRQVIHHFIESEVNKAEKNAAEIGSTSYQVESLVDIPPGIQAGDVCGRFASAMKESGREVSGVTIKAGDGEGEWILSAQVTLPKDSPLAASVRAGKVRAAIDERAEKLCNEVIQPPVNRQVNELEYSLSGKFDFALRGSCYGSTLHGLQRQPAYASFTPIGLGDDASKYLSGDHPIAVVCDEHYADGRMMREDPAGADKGILSQRADGVLDAMVQMLKRAGFSVEDVSRHTYNSNSGDGKSIALSISWAKAIEENHDNQNNAK